MRGWANPYWKLKEGECFDCATWLHRAKNLQFLSAIS